MIPFVTCIPPLRRYAATRGVAVERPSRKIQQINFRNRRRQAKMSRRTLPVLILCCAFASQALLSTAFVAGRPSSKNIGRAENTKAQLTFVDADLASASDLLANVHVADHHLLIADSATANDVAANYKTPGGFIFLAYILFSFWAGGVELVKRVQNWQAKKQEE